ncbi:MAG: toxic anion resistance protein [Mangrovicoccus sp.]
MTKTTLTPDAVKLVTDVVLPEAEANITALDQAHGAQQAVIEQRIAEIDMADTGSIINFGATKQAELQKISQDMLADVRNKDLGPAGDSLRDMVTTIRGFSTEELDPNRKRSWWERLTGKGTDVAKFIARYETVQGQIDAITSDLDRHEHQLLKDVKSLDLLYEKTLAFYDELALYIAAGDAKLAQLDSGEIPALEASVAAAAPDDQVMRAQELRDLRAARDDLERRVHDLRLTRQVTMQSLPSIRLVQENDKSLITKINSTLVNTVPLWETQLAQALTIQRSQEAAQAVATATDLTNELLTKNAANLRQANKTVRAEVERRVFDIEAVKQANADLVATIEESLAIADAGKAKRREAEGELQKMEGDLRDALKAAKARSAPQAAG